MERMDNLYFFRLLSVRENREFFISNRMAKQVNIPTYILNGAIRHFERVLQNSIPSDRSTKTLEAFRLGKQDLLKLKRLLSQYDKTDNRY